MHVYVVNSSSVNSFKNTCNLDRFWSNQEMYNFRCDIRNRKQKSELISNCIEVCYKEVDIEASKPASSTLTRYEYETIRYKRGRSRFVQCCNCAVRCVKVIRDPSCKI